MKIISTLRLRVGRIALMGGLAAIIVVGLAACGTSASSSTDPSAAGSLGGSSVPPTGGGSAAPTNTPGADMSTMVEPTQTQAQGSTSSNPAATPTQAAAGQSQSSGSVTQINATLREWAIDLSQKQAPAGKVQFTVTNNGQMAHDFTVLDSSGNQIGQTSRFRTSDGPQTLTVDLTAGTYTVICSLPGHAQRGQMATLVIK